MSGHAATLRAETTDQMHALGVQIGRLCRAGDVLILTGPLGAGKTTLTQGIGAGLGVDGDITSPTFVLARIHRHEAGGLNLVHVDAYRLEKPSDVDGLDIEDWMVDSVVVAEWGRGRVEHLTEQITCIDIERPTGAAGSDEADSGGVRTVAITGSDDRWSAISFAGRIN